MPDLQPNSSAIRQKDGEKWTAAADLQPTFPKSDRLLEPFLMQKSRLITGFFDGHQHTGASAAGRLTWLLQQRLLPVLRRLLLLLLLLQHLRPAAGAPRTCHPLRWP